MSYLPLQRWEKLLCSACIAGVVAISAFQMATADQSISGQPPARMIDDRFRTEPQCEARTRLYDANRAAYWNLARAVLKRDGVPWKDRRTIQLDHIVPWCLCGTDDLSNLRTEPLAAADRDDTGLEDRLCAQVRRGTLSLPEAQARAYQAKMKQ